MVGLIRQSFSLTSNLFKKLCTTFVCPHLEYAQRDMVATSWNTSTWSRMFRYAQTRLLWKTKTSRLAYTSLSQISRWHDRSIHADDSAILPYEQKTSCTNQCTGTAWEESKSTLSTAALLRHGIIFQRKSLTPVTWISSKTCWLMTGKTMKSNSITYQKHRAIHRLT